MPAKLFTLIQMTGLLTLMAVSACHRNYMVSAPVPALPCKVEGACDVTIMRYIKKFNKEGIKVITIGQSYLVSIPAAYLFEDQSPHMRWGSFALLNQVATFLKQFRKIAVTVTSYSSKYVSVQRERALTLARSRVVAEYLWSQGVDSRFIFTQGLGSDKPIIATLKGGDASSNARIEITFMNAIASR